MSSTKKGGVSISVDRLEIGLYVDVGLPWTEHPFLFRKFRIKTQAEITIIRSLLDQVEVFPAKSLVGVKSLPPDQAETPIESLGNQVEMLDKVNSDAWALKQQTVEKARIYRAERLKLARRYQEAAKRVQNYSRDLKSAPANAVRDSGQIVDFVLDEIGEKKNVLIDLINLSDSAYGQSGHALNVTVLALCIGKALELDKATMRTLARGALLHDVGKSVLPAALLCKKASLTKADQASLEKHTLFGLRLVENLPGEAICDEIKAIIVQHHEMLDGSGYPRGLKAGSISKLTQIVAIANTYDNLCNPTSSAPPLNPKAAMATLYSKYTNKLDGGLIKQFVRSMGVYPPGTLVKLSDDSVGLVINVDSGNLLKPRILLYHPDFPASDALMLDLNEASGLTIAEVLKPEDCPEAVKRYLGLNERLGYFIS